MFKKMLCLVLFVLLSVVSVSADQFYDGSQCRDYINLYTDTLYLNGKVEVMFVDCDGIGQQKIFSCTTRNDCLDTRYGLFITAIPDKGYKFSTWGNKAIQDVNSIDIELCHDLELYPVFTKKLHDDEDNYNCFIQTIRD